MLEIRNLTKIYRTKGGADVRALDDVSLVFEDTGMIFLLGKSGSGKSTLLNLIGGLDRPDAGEIIVKGRGSKTFSTSDFDSYRNTFIGFIFQEYNILNEFSVEDNIALALELQGKPKNKEKIAELLRSVDMEQYAKRKPNTLSGGQKQRIAIARALVKEPEIIMADEPTGALDSATGKQVFDTLKKLSEEKLVIVVSHDREFAEIYGDRIIELKDGKVISDVTKHKVQAVAASDNVSYIGDNTISVKAGAKLTQTDLSKIEKFILSADANVLISNNSGDIAAFRKQARIDDSGAREQFKETDEKQIKVREYAPEESKFIRSKLPFRHAMKIGLSSMRVKPFRLFFTIFLTFVAFVMFGLFSTLMLFNERNTIGESLEMSSDELVYVGKSYYMTYNYYNGDELTSSYTSSATAGFKESERQEIIENIDSNAVFTFNYSNSGNYGGSGEFFEISNVANPQGYLYSNKIAGFGITSETSAYRNDMILWGEYPQSADEIMISEYTFNSIKESGSVSVQGNSGMSDKQINEYSDLENVSLKIKNQYGGSGDGVALKVVGVYKCPEIPQKYSQTSQQASDMQYEWEQERVNGFYTYCLVSDDFYETNSKYFASQDNSYENKNYFDWTESMDIMLGESELGSFSGVAQLPQRSGLDKMTVYSLDGGELSSLGATGMAVSSGTLGSIISDNVSNYLNNLIDGENDSALNEWNSVSSALKKFRSGEYYDDTAQAYVKVTTQERLQAFADVMQFVNDYSISAFDNITIKEYGQEVSGTLVQIEGFFFENTDGAYLGEQLYSMMNVDTSNTFRDEMVTKYDPTGDIYQKVIFNKQAIDLDKVLDRAFTTADDDSFYSILNSCVTSVEDYVSLIEILSQVFLYVGIAFAVFSMLLLFNFISVSISSKKREIGILRAVGARSADVFKIFYSESAFITLICLVLSIIASFILCLVFNNLIAQELGVPLVLFVFGPVSIGIMIGIAVITSVISTFMPVYSIAKKRPVESIRAL